MISIDMNTNVLDKSNILIWGCVHLIKIVQFTIASVAAVIDWVSTSRN